jgi:hypothetical protein
MFDSTVDGPVVYRLDPGAVAEGEPGGSTAAPG